MRRVLLAAGFSSLFACVVCLNMSKTFSIMLFVASAVLFIASMSLKSVRNSVVLCVVFAFVSVSALNCYFTFAKIDNIKSNYTNKQSFVGEVVGQSNGVLKQFSYYLKDKNGVKLKVNSATNLFLDDGDKISVKSDITDKYSSTTTDYAQEIYLSTYIYNQEDIKIISENDGFSFGKFRTLLKNNIEKYTDYKTFGLIKALLFSDKSSISNENYTSLKRCGLLHATATSGMHLAVLCSMLMWIMNVVGLSQKKRSIICITFIVLFLLIVGFIYSAIRAGIMLIMVYIAAFFGREGDSANSIGFALIIFLLLNPYSALNCSLLLSTSATLGMIIAFPLLSEMYNEYFSEVGIVGKIAVAFLGSMSQSVIAILFTLPVTCIFFGYFSIIAPLSNMLLFPFISIAIVFGMLLICFSLVPFLTSVFGFVCDICSNVIFTISTRLSKFKYCLLSLDKQFTSLFILSCSIIISVCILLYYFKDKPKFKLIRVGAYLCVIAMLFCTFSFKIVKKDECNLQIFSSKLNLCSVLKYGSKSIVIGAGSPNSSYLLQDYFDKNAVFDVDMLIIKNQNSKYFKSCKELTYQFQPKYVIMNKNSGEYKAIERVGENSSFININNATASCYSNLKARFYEDILELTVNGNRVLFLDSNDDVSILPKKVKNPDIVVYIGNVALSGITASTSINISKENKNYIKSDKAYIANKPINIEFSDNNYKIRRAE